MCEDCGCEDRGVEYEQYEHHDAMVWVRSDLKDDHREHCLCYDCDKFKPSDRAENCAIANQVFTTCVEHNLVTPVWECPHFVKA
jgi:hypothetical protein